MLIYGHAIATKLAAEVMKRLSLTCCKPVVINRERIDPHGTAITRLLVWKSVTAIVCFSHIQNAFVWTQCNSIRLCQVVCNFLYFPGWSDSINSPVL